MRVFTPMRLVEGHAENHPRDLGGYTSMGIGDLYAVLGAWGDTGHVIVLNVTTGRIVPGGVHAGRFREAMEDEI